MVVVGVHCVVVHKLVSLKVSLLLVVWPIGLVLVVGVALLEVFLFVVLLCWWLVFCVVVHK